MKRLYMLTFSYTHSWGYETPQQRTEYDIFLIEVEYITPTIIKETENIIKAIKDRPYPYNFVAFSVIPEEARWDFVGNKYEFINF